MKIKHLSQIILVLFTFNSFGQKPCEEETRLEKAGLVDVMKIDQTFLVDLKYTTDDNFMKKDVYGCVNRLFLQPMAAQKLKKAHDWLKANHPDLRFLLYDGARSRAAQWKLWETLPQYSPKLRENYVANPRKGSIHNFGCAIDLTVASKDGKPLDMGTPFDFFGDTAYPRKEAQMLQEKKITKEHIANREILRNAMKAGGFQGITSEWWHFNAVSHKEAKRLYGIIE